MSKIKWTDATSYRQGQLGKIEPTGWRCKVDGLKMWISKGHRDYPDDWVMTAFSLGVQELKIGKSEFMSAEEAQKTAIVTVLCEAQKARATLNRQIDSLREAME